MRRGARQKSSNQQGVTLAELVVALGLLTVLGLGVSTVLSRVFQSQRSQSALLAAKSTADDIERRLRKAMLLAKVDGVSYVGSDGASECTGSKCPGLVIDTAKGAAKFVTSCAPAPTAIAFNYGSVIQGCSGTGGSGCPQGQRPIVTVTGAGSSTPIVFPHGAASRLETLAVSLCGMDQGANVIVNIEQAIMADNDTPGVNDKPKAVLRQLSFPKENASGITILK